MSSPPRPHYPLGLRLRTAVRRRHRLVAATLCALALTIVVLRLAPAGTDTDSGLVVLAAPRETAASLAALEGSGRVSLVLVAP